MGVTGFTLFVLTRIAWASDHNGGRGFGGAGLGGDSHARKGAALHHRVELPHGYLKVYSTRDEDNSGAYYSDSSYEIYSSNGRLFERVEHDISRTDEIIPWEVPLPAGSYTIIGHSAPAGEVCVHFVINTSERTIVDLDLAELEVYKRRFHVADRTGSSSE